jgi:hypothetical protein
MTAEMTAAPRRGVQASEGWALVQTMLADLTARIHDEAETEVELLDGLQVLARATALCSELSIDADPAAPWFFSMNTPARYIGGPNPDGTYHLCSIAGGRAYRIRGRRGTSRYLGFQVLAGTGLTPRRMAAYVSDRDLAVAPDGSFELVLSEDEPPATSLGRGSWVPIPADASAVVVRQYVSDPAAEDLATYDIESIAGAEPPQAPTDEEVGAAFTAMAWTIAKLVTLHTSPPMQRLIAHPNRFFAFDPDELGAADTTPDNLYVLGTWRLGPDEALVIETTPPATRFWNLVVENIWHECFDVRRRTTSLTDAGVVRRADGSVRLVLAGRDPGVANWLDTGGRHRGFMLFRWLDNPAAPDLEVAVRRVDEVRADEVPDQRAGAEERR